MKFDGGLNCMAVYIYMSYFIIYMHVYQSVRLACECTFFWCFFVVVGGGGGGKIGLDLNANIMFG